jgi:hypothetical protein
MISQAPQYGDREEEKLATASDTAAAPIGVEAQEHACLTSTTRNAFLACKVVTL